MTKPTFPDSHNCNKKSEAKLPLIIACGYRKIRIPKTAATFPTFLVRLPDQPAGVWRSKRDFLLLGRVDSSLLLPRTALKKIADLSPWRRPSLNTVRDAYYDAPDNYHVRMKKSLLQIDQFLQGISRCETDDAIKAWDMFCRPGDTDGLVPASEDGETAAATSETGSNVTSEMKSSKLGQYFCSSENAKQVVNWVIERCKSLLTNGSRVLFLEPSCGKGDVVKELVHQLDTVKAPQSQVSILCFDIDDNAVNACQQTLESCRYSIQCTCQDFLETKYKDLHDDSPAVFCLGGPPYTTGAGSHGDIQRDLPTQFIRHCIQEFSARAVCFLLPVRYKTILHTEEGYRDEIMELKSSTFFFQGTVPVTQPSIMQCYEKFNRS